MVGGGRGLRRCGRREGLEEVWEEGGLHRSDITCVH